jgi:3-hydroxyacyl-[acyl-carrier-protein] dehydratase
VTSGQQEFPKRAPQTDHLSLITDHFLGLPHRPPFVFVREIVDYDPGKSVNARTSFDANDPMFAGHFPGNPIVPGVIVTEALAQAAGIAAAAGYSENERPIFLLSAIRTMKFLRPVRPDEQIDLRAEKIAATEGLIQFKVMASVKGTTVAEGQLVLSVAAQPDPSA